MYGAILASIRPGFFVGGFQPSYSWLPAAVYKSFSGLFKGYVFA